MPIFQKYISMRKNTFFEKYDIELKKNHLKRDK